MDRPQSPSCFFSTPPFVSASLRLSSPLLSASLSLECPCPSVLPSVVFLSLSRLCQSACLSQSPTTLSYTFLSHLFLKAFPPFFFSCTAFPPSTLTHPCILVLLCSILFLSGPDAVLCPFLPLFFLSPSFPSVSCIPIGVTTEVAFVRLWQGPPVILTLLGSAIDCSDVFKMGLAQICMSKVPNWAEDPSRQQILLQQNTVFCFVLFFWGPLNVDRASFTRASVCVCVCVRCICLVLQKPVLQEL